MPESLIGKRTQPTTRPSWRALPLLVLGHVLLNLFENAIHYGRSDDAAARVEVTAALSGTWASLLVRDFGPGAPAHKHAKLMAFAASACLGQLEISTADYGGLFTLIKPPMES